MNSPCESPTSGVERGASKVDLAGKLIANEDSPYRTKTQLPGMTWTVDAHLLVQAVAHG